MGLRSVRPFGSYIPPAMLLLLLFTANLMLTPPVIAQTTQPFLFAGTYDNATSTSGLVTLLRNGSTGVLSMVPNTTVSFKDACEPSTIDPTGHFLFGICGDGVSMYTLDSTTGIVSETPASPYSASVSTGQYGLLVAAESTGQYVYLLKVGFTQSPDPSTFLLDTFQIDTTTPALIPVKSESLPFNGRWVDSVADPAHHGIFVFVNQDQGGISPTGVLFSIPFDPSTGTATIPSAGLPIGGNARSLAVSPSGAYLALGWGDVFGSLAVYQLSSSDFSAMTLIGSSTLGPESDDNGDYSFPDFIFFSPGGNLLYAQGLPPDFAGGGVPFLVFDPSTATPLATSPIPLANSDFLNGIIDPQAPFTYVSNSGSSNGSYGISVYQVDLLSGQPSQPTSISAPFFPQLQLSPLFATTEQTGQGIQGAALGISPSGITFASAIAGQTSNPQKITLKSLGSQSVTLSTIQISGANAADFTETDDCIPSPVLPTNHTCTISVTYAPSAVGSSEAILFITDNAPGSPQAISLSGNAVAAPPGAPAVTLNPASALNFPGTTIQGTTTSPQTITLTNSGDAALQMLSAVLSGFNSSDFSISADSCSGSIAAKASCTISLVFSPTATGVRSATLTLTDNAANSPQSISVTGSAGPAVTISPTSSTAATVTAGQTAQFNLQATPGTGFTGTLAFSCSGAPFGANCTVPTSLSVSNGSPVSFTVSVSTLGASVIPPSTRILSRPNWPSGISLAMLALLVLLVFLLGIQLGNSIKQIPQIAKIAAATALSLVLVFSGIGCGGGGGGSTTPPPPAQQTAATPSIQPGSGTYTASQSVSITDATAGATIYYTTDGSAPTSSSPVYGGPFSVNAATTIQAMATASGYSNSTIGNAVLKFRTPASTYPLTVTVTATPNGSSKPLPLNPISLTLIVN